MSTMETSASGLGISEQDQHNIEQIFQDIYQTLKRTQAQLIGPDGDSQELPPSLYKFLLQLIEDLNSGKSISIVQQNAAFTTVEAARILGVSRQFVVNLLERGEIPFHLVGTHRRMYARDLFRYKAKRDEKRMRAIQEMGQKEVEAGTYFD